MPFTEKDAQTAIGQMVINLWQTQKQLEEAREEIKALKESIGPPPKQPESSELISTK